MIKDIISQKIEEALINALKAEKLGDLKELPQEKLCVEKTKNPEFGDFAVNVSPLARHAKMPPVKIAEEISAFIDMEDTETSVISGFINFKTGKSRLNSTLKKVIENKENYGKNNIGQGEKTILEYVSANPTGPLHIGHGRWAAMGSSLANILKFSGYEIAQEFYINDAGNQINNLARSLWIRVLQKLGKDAQIPFIGDEAKNYYPGEYLLELADDYLAKNTEKAVELFAKNPDPYNPSEEILNEMSKFGKAVLLEQQKSLLNRLRVNFDGYFSETSLHESGEVRSCIDDLKKSGEIYESEGAIWFRSSKYGDDQDRVITKTDGSYTYLTADIAYHYDKLKRGYKKLINIWGADHHGYVARMKAAIEALGYDKECLEVLLGQLVNLIISGEQVRMGKRKKMITLEELVDDVGVDATRFWMIMRSIDTTLDFDVDLAKSSSDENPVYYVQYAHARACSILRNAVSERFDQENKTVLPPFITQEELNKIINDGFDENTALFLWEDKDEKAALATRSLILKLESFEETVQVCAKARAPYMIARYVQELAGDFHHFYTFTRVLNVEENIMKARLALVFATKQVLFNGLSLLGVSSPESM